MRKVYILPNLVTTMGMGAGFYSIVASTHYDFQVAAWAIIAASVFDALDGRVARMAKATSTFGVEYDSLSDLLSFGVAPAILALQWTLDGFGRIGWMTAFLYIACGAIRLARFNVTTSSLPKNFFQGLPIPGGAGMIASFVLFREATQWPSNDWVPQFTLFMVLALAGLMVSTLPFASFKEVNWRSRASYGLLFVIMLSIVLIAVRAEVTLFLIGTAFIFANIGWYISRIIRKKPLVSSPVKVAVL